MKYLMALLVCMLCSPLLAQGPAPGGDPPAADFFQVQITGFTDYGPNVSAHAIFWRVDWETTDDNAFYMIVVYVRWLNEHGMPGYPETADIYTVSGAEDWFDVGYDHRMPPEQILSDVGYIVEIDVYKNSQPLTNPYDTDVVYIGSPY